MHKTQQLKKKLINHLQRKKGLEAMSPHKQNPHHTEGSVNKIYTPHKSIPKTFYKTHFNSLSIKRQQRVPSIRNRPKHANTMQNDESRDLKYNYGGGNNVSLSKGKIQEGFGDREKPNSMVNAYQSHSQKIKVRHQTGIDFDRIKLRSRDSKMLKVYSDKLKMKEGHKISSVSSQRKFTRQPRQFQFEKRNLYNSNN